MVHPGRMLAQQSRDLGRIRQRETVEHRRRQVALEGVLTGRPRRTQGRRVGGPVEPAEPDRIGDLREVGARLVERGVDRRAHRFALCQEVEVLFVLTRTPDVGGPARVLQVEELGLVLPVGEHRSTEQGDLGPQLLEAPLGTGEFLGAGARVSATDTMVSLKSVPADSTTDIFATSAHRSGV